MMSREDVKNISPKLSKNKEWAEYVDYSWNRFTNLGVNWGDVALGFEWASRGEKKL